MENAVIFDSHAHYDDSRFDLIREETLAKMPENNVCGIINCGTDISTSLISVDLSQKFPFIYAAIGYHPESVNGTTVFEKDKLIELAKNKKVVAIGEIGLDYYWDTSYKKNQIDFFEKQLMLSKELDLPVIIHDRDAHGDTLEILKKHNPKGVLHCFSGSIEMAREVIKLGLYIGVGGVVTFKNSKKLVEIVREMPLERILLETDAPYLSPEPYRGKTNNSAYILHVAEKIAEIKDITTEEVLSVTTKNVKTLFNI